ncbi:branched-chain amino acid ABC transporter permease [Halobacterium sp. DL1]|nr:branched-chain amino acid ABC transporter permease [Halobacterium sp. DL1]
MSSTPDPAVWLAVLVLGAGTQLYRVSFVEAVARFGSPPEWVERRLEYVPVAVLGALTLPAVVYAGPGTTVELPKLLAALVATLVAWRTESVPATIVFGMGTLWLLRLVSALPNGM